MHRFTLCCLRVAKRTSRFGLVLPLAGVLGIGGMSGCKPEPRCDEQCALDLFLEVSKTFRPSNQESQLRSWVQNQFDRALTDEVWSAEEATAAADAAGNVVVRLPATASAYKDRRPVVLQAHLDMVLAVAGAEPGKPLEQYFASGVDVVNENGVMHSRDFKTTLGADNGAGVAQLVRFIRDRSIPHPPLELVFTIAEELGLVGAQKYDAAALPLSGSVMINLDGMSVADWTHPDINQPPAITYGANGGTVTNLDGKLRSEPLGGGAKQATITLRGLLGGHSGVYIGQKRMNSIRTLAAIVEQLGTLGYEPQLVSIAVGQVQARAGQNKIPDAFTLTVALRADAVLDQVNQKLQSFIAAYAAAYTDEVAANIKLTVEVAAQPAASALPKDVSQMLAHALATVPNGVIKENPEYPQGVEVSSNLAVLGLSTEEERSFYLGYLPRAYVVLAADAVAEQIHGALHDLLVADGKETAFTKTQVPGWAVPRDAVPIKLAAAAAGELLKQYIRTPSSTEVGVFIQKFPQLKDRAFGLGPVITEAHTPNESMNVASFLDTTRALDKILRGFGDDPELLK